MDRNQATDRYVYRLDATDTITFVSPEWLRFAAENEAPELTEPAVVGQPVWRFIAGEETRRLYAELFRDLRVRPAEIMVPFRCDSPTVVRHMTLGLRSHGGGEIELEGRLLRLETREPVDVLARWAERSAESQPICSLCRRLLVGGEWVDAGTAIVRRRLFSVAPVPRLVETVCATCGDGRA
ncbi:MAG: hypothetical protein ACYDIE_00810 [Candidatus Krumholzibacteriia bacterium]